MANFFFLLLLFFSFFVVPLPDVITYLIRKFI